jgi:riboflavin kinase / FMN adenylyltransferase
MKVIVDPEEPLKFSTSATIGIFDGVHIGHKKIISLVRKDAKEKGSTSCVITFYPHPQKVLRGTDILLIVPLKERFRLLEKEEVEVTVCYNFTKEFAAISAEDFIKDILVRKLSVKSMFVGPDFLFGRRRGGNLELLEAMGRTYKFETRMVEPAVLDGEVVSSTTIRNLIEDGMVKKAAQFLGNHFSIDGRIKEGEKRGRKLGFPTANLDTVWQIFPKRGVYVTWTYLEGDRFRSVTNVGLRPTFGENQLLIETHIIDFRGDAYGKTMRIEFVDRLRDEKHYESVDALVAQISKDVEQAKEILTVFE